MSNTNNMPEPMRCGDGKTRWFIKEMRTTFALMVQCPGELIDECCADRPLYLCGKDVTECMGHNCATHLLHVYRMTDRLNAAVSKHSCVGSPCYCQPELAYYIDEVMYPEYIEVPAPAPKASECPPNCALCQRGISHASFQAKTPEEVISFIKKWIEGDKP